MATFNIRDVGQLAGESPVSPVANESAGQREKLAGSAIKTFGSLAKGAYEGYVVAGMEGTAGNEGQVPNLPDDEKQQNRGFTKLVQAYQSGALSQRDAQLLAKRQKNEAIAQAPWMREKIEQRYSNFFGAGGGSGGTGGVFGEQRDEQEMIKDVMIKSLTKDVKAGEFHVGFDETDDTAVRRYANYQKNKVEMNALSDFKDKNFEDTLAAIDGATPAITTSFTNKLASIVASDRPVEEKKQLIYNVRNATIAEIKKETGLKGLTPEKSKVFDERVSSKLDTIITAYDRDSVLTGSANVDQINANIEEFVQSNVYTNLVNNKDVATLAVARELIGDTLAEFALQSKVIDISALKNISVKTFGKDKQDGIGRDIQEVVTRINQNKLKDGDSKVIRQSLKFMGSFRDKSGVDEYFQGMSPRQLQQNATLATEFMNNDVHSAVMGTLEANDIDPHYLNGLDIYVNDSGTGVEFDIKDEFEGTWSDEDIVEAKKAMRSMKKLEPEFSGYYNVSKAAGATDRTILSEITKRFQYGILSENKPRPFVEEAGDVSRKAVRGFGSLAGDTAEVLNMDVGDYYMRYIGRPFSEGVNTLGKTLGEVLEEFERGYKSGEQEKEEPR